MTLSMYCLYVGFDYTYININALAHGIKSFLASQVWFQVIAGDRTYGKSMFAVIDLYFVCIDVCTCVCMCVCMYVCVCVCVCIYIYIHVTVHMSALGNPI